MPVYIKKEPLETDSSRVENGPPLSWRLHLTERWKRWKSIRLLLTRIPFLSLSLHIVRYGSISITSSWTKPPLPFFLKLPVVTYHRWDDKNLPDDGEPGEVWMSLRLRRVIRNGAETRWSVWLNGWIWTRKRSTSCTRILNWGTHEFSRASNRSCKISVGLMNALLTVPRAGNGSSAFDCPTADCWLIRECCTKEPTMDHSVPLTNERITLRIVTRMVPRSRSMSSTDPVKTSWQYVYHSSSKTLATWPPQLLANLERVRRFAFELPCLRRLLVESHLRFVPMSELLPSGASETLVDTVVEFKDASMILQAARAISIHISQRIFQRKYFFVLLKLAPNNEPLITGNIQSKYLFMFCFFCFSYLLLLSSLKYAAGLLPAR